MKEETEEDRKTSYAQNSKNQYANVAILPKDFTDSVRCPSDSPDTLPITRATNLKLIWKHERMQSAKAVLSQK